LTDDEYNVLFAVIMGQAKSAANGNTSAFKELSDILKADEELQAEHQFELPARILGRAFVDVHRMVLNHEYSEFVFKGGRLSLKSSTIPLFIFELIKQNPTFHALAVRPYENTLRDSVYAQFQWAISELDDSHNWKLTTSPMQCEYLPTGQRIYLRGADDPGKIKSIKPPFGHIAILWFEELDQFRGEEQIRDVTQSAIRGGDIGYVFKSFNPPRSRSAWANRYVAQHKPNMYVHHSTYLEAPTEWLGSFALEEAEMLKELNEKAWRHEYLGEPVGDGANVFENVSLRKLSDDEIKQFDRQYFGQDWGWFPDPNAFEAMHFDANRRILYLFDEVTGNKQTND
ncbi:PBSX family phage terminase large subunit, partial [Candidatus Saccharibacteria bacterium]|nr:PBSX family phage terminase large subunit [Candidatus Saccharibacteria bacterium]